MNLLRPSLSTLIRIFGGRAIVIRRAIFDGSCWLLSLGTRLLKRLGLLLNWRLLGGRLGSRFGQGLCGQLLDMLKGLRSRALGELWEQLLLNES